MVAQRHQNLPRLLKHCIAFERRRRSAAGRVRHRKVALVAALRRDWPGGYALTIVRGLLRNFGLKVGPVGAVKFDVRIRERVPELVEITEASLAARQPLTGSLRRCTKTAEPCPCAMASASAL